MASDITINVIGRDRASRVFKSIASTASTAFKGLAAAAIGGTAALGGFALAAGKLALDAAPIEGVAGAFEGLAGGALEAEKALENLRRGSFGQITDADLMRQFNKAAQLVGQTFAQQLPNAMGYLGKVSAATGDDMNFLLNSLTTGIGRLSPMILDNLGITVDLSDAYETYAASLGKSASELTKTEQQTALMNQVLEKLAENTADMPDLTDNMSIKWGAFTTKLQNLRDELGLKLLPLFERFADKVLPLVVDWAGKLADTFVTLVNYFAFAAEEGDHLNDFLADLPSFLQAPIRLIGELVSGLEGMGQIARDSITTFQQAMAGEWEDDPEKILPIHRLFGNIGTAISEFQRGFDSGEGEGLLKRLFLGGMEAADDFLPADVLTRIYNLRDAVANIQNLLSQGDIAGALSTFMPPAWAEMVAGAAEALGNFGEKLGLAKFLVGEGEWITALSLFVGSEWAERVGEAAEKLGEFAGRVADFIKENPQQLVDFAIDLGLAFVGWQVLATIIPLLFGAAGAVAAMLSPVGILTILAFGLGLAWATNFGDMRKKTEQLGDALYPLFSDFIDDITNDIPDGFDEMGEAMEGIGWDEFIAFLEDAVYWGNKVADFLNAASKWAYDFGQALNEVLTLWDRAEPIFNFEGATGAPKGGDKPLSPTAPTGGGGGGGGDSTAQFAPQVTVTIQDSRTPEETARVVVEAIGSAAGAF